MEVIVKSLIGIFTIVDGKIYLLMEGNNLFNITCNDNVELENNLIGDYELPEYDNITFELAEEYANAKLEDGVLKVTRPENFEDDAVIKLIGTATYKKATATKEFEIIISKKDPENVTSVTVTDENLGIGAYANGSKVVTGVKFSYTQLGKYDYDIQMRYKNNIHSSICNVTPFNKKLETNSKCLSSV